MPKRVGVKVKKPKTPDGAKRKSAESAKRKSAESGKRKSSAASQARRTLEQKKATILQKPKKKYSISLPKREHLFKVRNSLAELVDSELSQQGTSVFYQRVFILAKNIESGIVESRGSNTSAATDTETNPIALDDTTVASTAVEGSAITNAATGANTTANTTATTSVVIQAPNDPESPHSALSEELPPAPNPTQTPPVLLADEEKVTKTYKFNPIVEMADDENASQTEGDDVAVKQRVKKERPPDFFDFFMEKLMELSELCAQKTYTTDPLSGLFLYMGNYTMLMVESSEDIIGLFCKELAEVCPNFWLDNRVFQIEDKISETYFSSLISRRIPAAFINEKFPTSTPNDEYLMAKEHRIIKEKLNQVCAMLSDELALWDIQQEIGSISSGFKVDHVAQRQRISENLPIDPYRKMLPELQRIELVLSSQRFYFTLDEFSSIYGSVPVGRDDDSLFWPEQNNYLPPKIFERSEFDVNLTFGDYGKEVARASDDANRHSVDEPKAEEEPAQEEEAAQ